MQRHPSLPSLEWVGASNGNAVAVSAQSLLTGNKSSAPWQGWLTPRHLICTVPGTQPAFQSKQDTSIVLCHTEPWNKSWGPNHTLSTGNICIKKRLFDLSSKKFTGKSGSWIFCLHHNHSHQLWYRRQTYCKLSLN